MGFKSPCFLNIVLSSNWLGHRPFTAKITGSSPVGTTNLADVAQLVERVICNLEVVGSNPSIGSNAAVAEW